MIDVEIDGYVSALGSRKLRALVDSGADATMIPIHMLNAVGAAYQDTMWMRGVTGARIEIDRYLVAIRIDVQVIHGLSVIGAPEEAEAVLGRDLLNQLVITLDGPARVIEVRTGTLL
jgi:predicted aspartyl protease